MRLGTLATAEVWCVVESASGIISACLPTLGNLVQICARKIGLTSGLTWSSGARTPSAGTHLQTIGGSGAPKKSNNASGTFDDSKKKNTGSRPFDRLSAISGLSEERGWDPKSSVRTHDVESERSLGSDEVPLRNIVVRTETDVE